MIAKIVFPVVFLILAYLLAKPSHKYVDLTSTVQEALATSRLASAKLLNPGEMIQRALQNNKEYDFPKEVIEWATRGKFMVINGFNIFYQDLPFVGNKEDDRGTLLLVHGFPTSSFDYRQSLPVFTRSFRVILFDFLGFGLSDKPDPSRYSYSLMEQADIAIQLWYKLNVTQCHVVGHDMGDSVLLEILARRERNLLGWFDSELKSLTLNNGGIIMELHNMRLAQHILRYPIIGPLFASLSRYIIFKKQLETVLKDPTTFPERETQIMWEVGLVNKGNERLPELIGYVSERSRWGNTRWLDALLRTDLPLHIIWGKHDTVAPVEIHHRLERLKQTATFTLVDTGHFPMVEDSSAWANAVMSFYKI